MRCGKQLTTENTEGHRGKTYCKRCSWRRKGSFVAALLWMINKKGCLLWKRTLRQSERAEVGDPRCQLQPRLPGSVVGEASIGYIAFSAKMTTVRSDLRPK